MMCDDIIVLSSSSNSPPSSPCPSKHKLEGITNTFPLSPLKQSSAVHQLSDSDTDTEAPNDVPDQIDFSTLSAQNVDFDFVPDISDDAGYCVDLQDFMDYDNIPLSQDVLNEPLSQDVGNEPLSQDVGNEPLSQVSKTDKEARKEEKRKLKERKEHEKKERMEAAEKFRAIKPGECMKYLVTHIDPSIIESSIGQKACELLSQTELKFMPNTNEEPDTVKWLRTEAFNVEVPSEKHLLYIWSCDKILTAVKYQNLLDTFNEKKRKFPGYHIHLGIYGLKEYFRKAHAAMQRNFKAQIDPNTTKKRKKSNELMVSRHELDLALVELEVITGISSRKLNTPDDLALLIYQFGKSIAETPYKLQIEKKDNERAWFARGDSRDCVRIDKDFNGLFRLWQQQLCQFHHSSNDVARAVTERYPTPLSLYEAYLNLPSQKEREALLQDIPIMRNIGPSTSNRRIGPELSRKIALMFSQKNGSIMLSQE